MNPLPTRKTVAQACDACRRRKIKCNGLQPCPACLSAKLSCTFNVPQKRGGNQGARATVLNELRGNLPSNRGESPSPTSLQSASNHTIGLSQHPSPPHSGLETITIDACIDAYMERIYPVVPFLNLEILRKEVEQTSDSLLSRQFIIAFCAYVVTFGRILDESLLASSHTTDSELGKQLLDAALRIQNQERILSPSCQSVFISFFLYGAYAGLGNYRQGWFYLSEAATLLMMQKGESDPSWYSKAIYKRTFWVMLISQRAHAIRRNRPITLSTNPGTPLLEDPEERGLRYLASLFQPFDEVFFSVWNGSRQDCSKEWLLALERDVRTALPQILDVSNEQIANLRVSQLWLQVKLWELFPRFGFLSSESVYECLTFRYPIVLARDLVILATNLPVPSLQVHGVGMVCAYLTLNDLQTNSRRPRRSSTLLVLSPMYSLLYQFPHLTSN